MDSSAVEVPVFYPSMDDMRGSFERYVESIEPQFAHVGICKIVPPPAWTPRKVGYDDIDGFIPKPIRQHATGRKGLFRTLMLEGKPMSVRDEFRPMAESKENLPKTPDDMAELEREFWKRITYTPPLYGADVEGSLFDEKCNGWNIRNLNTVLSRTIEKTGLSLPGVTTPYLYWGMWRSAFAWHTEDMDLYSVNYLHFGKPKSWYCIQPEHRPRFETLVQGLIPELIRNCPQFMRHKEILISPALLKQHNIPVVTTVQREREFVLNFPGAYHAGFNHGFNCAESTNFGTAMWVPVGAKAKYCRCDGDSVHIDMNLFLPPHLQKVDPAKPPVVAVPPPSPGRPKAQQIRAKATASPIKENRSKPAGDASVALKAARVLKVKSIKLKTPDGVKALSVRAPVTTQSGKRKQAATTGKITVKSLPNSTARKLLAMQKQGATKLKARATTPGSRATELKAARAKLALAKARLKTRDTAVGTSRPSPAKRISTPGTPARTAVGRSPTLLASSPSKKADQSIAADGPPRRAVKRLAKGDNGWLRPAEPPSTPSLSRVRGAPNTAGTSAKPSTRSSTLTSSPSTAVPVPSNDPNAPRQLRSGKPPSSTPLPSDRKRKQPETASTSVPAREAPRGTSSKPSSSSSSCNHRQEAATTFVKGSEVFSHSRRNSNSHSHSNSFSNIGDGQLSAAIDVAPEPSSNSNTPASPERKGVHDEVVQPCEPSRKSPRTGRDGTLRVELGWVECNSCSKWCSIPVDRIAQEPTTKWECQAAGISCGAPPSLGAPRLGICGSGTTPDGWQRWLTERKKRKKATAHKWEVSYRSPCGMLLRSRQEVAQLLLHQPQYSDLTVSNFCFDTRTSGNKSHGVVAHSTNLAVV
uniref:[Histone H3]-trimethyl-L-lysine(9) demethylase n=1 Tax=Pyramimonas obovata TaxID=1411642 RepID=A0A7S0MTN4_9CHLO|mmetsp:Transcript_124/g.295  ORF Transcript_124/g.295 Transcript_124/m.295 type:complete len:868 (+) Transcript_124:302-2905(+)|eukprot:CAMPEP_0118933966 /NCGR_PEP_ID=MMETSP1169-20130426/13131_1 /TAXON_ID=36882 /ORGANISM="Pyramimonas obovata, Strain CCMP722" /LENGTH=867 /DNA_ID=CAMNT_0006876809 /DNA_START=301 /DNA_END=2904 /DNA_ORIENTATION=+